MMDEERPEASHMAEIVKAIREVEATIDRRAVRTLAAVLMMWGVVAAAIYAFYWLVCLDAAPYERVFGRLLGPLWLFPIALAYAFTALASARVSRLGTSPRESRKLAVLVVAFAAPLVVNAFGDFIVGVNLAPPGLGVAFIAALLLSFRLERTDWLRWTRLAMGALLVPLGVLLFFWTPCAAHLVAAFASAAGLFGFGLLKLAVEG